MDDEQPDVYDVMSFVALVFVGVFVVVPALWLGFLLLAFGFN
jgi:hypothetical protein